MLLLILTIVIIFIVLYKMKEELDIFMSLASVILAMIFIWPIFFKIENSYEASFFLIFISIFLNILSIIFLALFFYIFEGIKNYDLEQKISISFILFFAISSLIPEIRGFCEIE